MLQSVATNPTPFTVSCGTFSEKPRSVYGTSLYSENKNVKY